MDSKKFKKYLILGILIGSVIFGGGAFVIAEVLIDSHSVVYRNPKGEVVTMDSVIDDLYYAIGDGSKVTVTNLLAENIKNGITVTVKKGDETVSSVTGTSVGSPKEIRVSYAAYHNHPNGTAGNNNYEVKGTAVFTLQSDGTYSLTSGGSVGTSGYFEASKNTSATAKVTGITLVY